VHGTSTVQVWVDRYIPRIRDHHWSLASIISHHITSHWVDDDTMNNVAQCCAASSWLFSRCELSSRHLSLVWVLQRHRTCRRCLVCPLIPFQLMKCEVSEYEWRCHHSQTFPALRPFSSNTSFVFVCSSVWCDGGLVSEWSHLWIQLYLLHCCCKVALYQWRRWKTCSTFCASTILAFPPSNSISKNATSSFSPRRKGNHTGIAGSRHMSFICKLSVAVLPQN